MPRLGQAEPVFRLGSRPTCKYNLIAELSKRRSDNRGLLEGNYY